MAGATGQRPWMDQVSDHFDNQQYLDEGEVKMTIPEVSNTSAMSIDTDDQFQGSLTYSRQPAEGDGENTTPRTIELPPLAFFLDGVSTANPEDSTTPPNLPPISALNKKRQLDNGASMEFDETTKGKGKATDIDIQSDDEPAAKRPSPPRSDESLISEARRRWLLQVSMMGAARRIRPVHDHHVSCSCGRPDHAGSSKEMDNAGGA